MGCYLNSDARKQGLNLAEDVKRISAIEIGGSENVDMDEIDTLNTLLLGMGVSRRKTG